jgi:hypothetical protein
MKNEGKNMELPALPGLKELPPVLPPLPPCSTICGPPLTRIALLPPPPPAPQVFSEQPPAPPPPPAMKPEMSICDVYGFVSIRKDVTVFVHFVTPHIMPIAHPPLQHPAHWPGSETLSPMATQETHCPVLTSQFVAAPVHCVCVVHGGAHIELVHVPEVH